MLGYVLKKILWFIPTLFAVTAIGFILLSNAPGDPPTILTSSNSANGVIKGKGDLETQKNYWRNYLGLDLPLFYFSINALSEPDTLYKIYDEDKLKTYKALLKQTGNNKTISLYYKELEKTNFSFEKELQKIKKDSSYLFLLDEKEQIHSSEIALNGLKAALTLDEFNYQFEIIKSSTTGFKPEFIQQLLVLKNAANQLYQNTTIYKNYIPKIVWYGTKNQYHQWLFGGANTKGILKGDFGISYIKKEPVMSILKDKLIWSIFFSLLSIILAYAISIPIGIKMAEKPNSPFTKKTQTVLFLLYSMPSFFIGVLLLMLFANPDVLSIFPPSGIKPINGYNDNASLLSKLFDSIPYIILPLICYTYSSLAFISKLTATSINEQLKFDYIKTARAKGLTEKKIIWKHALKNSALPLITVFSSIFPSIIGGSVVIESIYSIPGMGLETIKAIVSQDYPIVIAIITLCSILTVFSYLLADILYALVDPRIRT